MGYSARIIATVGMLALLLASPAVAQPPWLDKPIAQPYTDVPWYSRFNTCPTGPPVWTCSPDDDACDTACASPAHRFCGWYGSATAAPLFYDAVNGDPVVQVGTTNVPGLSTNDLKTEFAPGGRYTVGRALSECFRIDGTYLGTQQWDAFAAARNRDNNAVAGQGNFTSIFSNFGNPNQVVGLDYNNLATLRLDTWFTSGEVNGRLLLDMPYGPLDLWVTSGCRYMSIKETLDFHTESTAGGGTVNDLNAHTTNQLWGAQIGLQSKYLVTRYWWIDADLKGCIAANTFTTRRTYTPTVAGIAGGPFIQNGTDTKTAFVGDWAVTGNYQVFNNLTLTAGYQLLCVTGLALGQNQIPNNAGFLNPGPLVPDHSGTVLYHGPMLGLTWAR